MNKPRIRRFGSLIDVPNFYKIAKFQAAGIDEMWAA
jgi:hypothetical protein